MVQRPKEIKNRTAVQRPYAAAQRPKDIRAQRPKEQRYRDHMLRHRGQDNKSTEDNRTTIGTETERSGESTKYGIWNRRKGTREMKYVTVPDVPVPMTRWCRRKGLISARRRRSSKRH